MKVFCTCLLLPFSPPSPVERLPHMCRLSCFFFCFVFSASSIHRYTCTTITSCWQHIVSTTPRLLWHEQELPEKKDDHGGAPWGDRYGPLGAGFSHIDTAAHKPYSIAPARLSSNSGVRVRRGLARCHSNFNRRQNMRKQSKYKMIEEVIDHFLSPTTMTESLLTLSLAHARERLEWAGPGAQAPGYSSCLCGGETCF